ncbi:MAG: hypothetical protein IPO17_14680 [Flavobacteriales bacterium]|nr:hypothetical protein [Flavobacteriales bacterium]
MRTVRLLVALAFFSCEVLMAQEPRRIEPRLLGGYGIGLQMAKLEPDSGEAFKQLPWFSGQLELGGSLLMNERWGIAMGGMGTFNGRYFYSGSNSIGLYHVLLRAEARAWWQTPWSRADDKWFRIGCAFGNSFIRTAYHEHVEDGFEVRSRSNPHDAFYLAPEIGAMQLEDGPHRLEIGLRYRVHLDRRPAITTVLTTPNSSTHATAVHDQLSIVMRYHLGLTRRDRPHIARPAVAYESRATDTIATLHARNRIITLELWDDAEVDGDTITVLLNERPVLAEYALAHKHKKVRVALEPGNNRILLVAHNEGRVPPNTARMNVHGVKGSPQLVIKTSTHQNQVVEIRWEQGGDGL